MKIIAVIFGILGIYLLKAAITGKSFIFKEYQEKDIFIVCVF